jgi:hypothetical protein
VDTVHLTIRYTMVIMAVLTIIALMLVGMAQVDSEHPHVHEYCISQSIRDAAHGGTAC